MCMCGLFLHAKHHMILAYSSLHHLWWKCYAFYDYSAILLTFITASNGPIVSMTGKWFNPVLALSFSQSVKFKIKVKIHQLSSYLKQSNAKFIHFLIIFSEKNRLQTIGIDSLSGFRKCILFVFDGDLMTYSD